MQYSPKLKVAMEDIKSILKTYDIAGVVVLHTPGFSEYLNHVETSYSCAKFEGNLSFKLKSEEVGIEKAQSIAEGTFNMVTHFSDVLGPITLTYMDAQKLLNEKLGGEEFGGSHTSHNQQNN